MKIQFSRRKFCGCSIFFEKSHMLMNLGNILSQRMLEQKIAAIVKQRIILIEFIDSHVTFQGFR